MAPSSIKGDNRNKEYYILLSAKLNAPNLVSNHGQEHYLFTQNERTALRTLLVSNTKGKDQLAVKTTLEKHLQVSNQEHNLLMFADKLHPINLLISNVHKLAQACCKKLHSKTTCWCPNRSNDQSLLTVAKRTSLKTTYLSLSRSQEQSLLTVTKRKPNQNTKSLLTRRTR